MSNEENKEYQEYIDKSRNIINAISNILRLDSGDIINDSMRSDLEKIKENANKMKQKLEKREFEIAIVGLEKAGKSSFSNAMIENNLLPTDDQRCTYTSTCIQYSENDNAIVSFYSKDEFKRDFADKLEKIGIKNASDYPFESISLSKYESLYDNLGDSGKRYAETLNEEIKDIINNRDSLLKYLSSPPKAYAGEQLEDSEFRGFIRDAAKAMAVKEVKIGSSKLNKIKNAVIYDVPGFNSPTQMHQKQTSERMDSADAIVMVAKGDEPSITGEVLKIFNESDEDGTQLKDKLFVFANKSDRATDIEKNKNITYNEWINRHKFISDKDRIVFGSANAHLQSEKIIEGTNFIDEARKKLGEEDCGGIKTIKDVLARYNDNERFNVLKKRINRMQNELISKFEAARKEYNDVDTNNFSPLAFATAISTATNAKKIINDKLDKYRSEIQSKFRENKILSDKINEKIDAVVSIEKYQITENEINTLHSHYGDSGTNEQVSRVEVDIRKEKMQQMYNDFSNEVVKIASDWHEVCAGEIVEICMESMNIHKDSKYYNELKCKVKDMFKDIIGNNYDGYYQSLVERFSRDLYEILIYTPYNEERYNRFRKDMENFYSLSVFYSHSDETSHDYIHIPPVEQPMCRFLLFHELNNISENSGKLYQTIKKVAGITADNAALIKLVGELTGVYPVLSEAESFIENICRAISMYSDDDSKISMIKNQIQAKVSGTNDIYSCDISDEKEFRSKYSIYQATHRCKNYKDIIAEFSKDIDILHDILKNAFLKAISIEKPFVAKETKIIEDINRLLDTDIFVDFIANNLKYIEYDKMSAIDEREGKRKINAACLHEIDAYLQKLNKEGANI